MDSCRFGKISVKVLDSDSGLGVENAFVELDGTLLSGYTNQYGKLLLTDIQQGIYSLTISADGYFGINLTI